MSQPRSESGYTLVEILVVVSIIGILASVTTISVSQIRQTSAYTAAKNDIRHLAELVELARGLESRPLSDITGSVCSECACRNVGGSIHDLDSSHNCWTRSEQVIEILNNSVNGLKTFDPENRDPWGGPYMVNENEGEVTPTWPTGCHTDNITSAGPDGILQNDDDIVFNLPGSTCSPVAGSHRENQNWE